METNTTFTITSTTDLDVWKDFAEKWQKTHPEPQSHPCPACGYCPHCGRGGYQTYPYYPNVTPYAPWPMNPIIWCRTEVSGTFNS